MAKRGDIIKKKGGKFLLVSHEGKTLGEHATEAEARSQESAINISKARAAGHHIAKPQDMQAFYKAKDAGDPNCETEPIPVRMGNKWVVYGPDGTTVAGEYDPEAENMHLQEGFANPNLEVETGPSNEANAEGKKDSKTTFGAKRYDTGELAKPLKMGNGWLRADGYLTRTGVFTYRNADGTERRELRKPEDVFHPAHLDSIKMMPITDTHPPEFLTSRNTGEHQRGHMGEKVEPEGTLIKGNMLFTDAALIQKLERGDMNQISMGYTCDVDETPGTTETGEMYDGIQKNIRANHVAIVPRGRAGAEARVHMDSEASVMLSIQTLSGANRSNSPGGGTTVKKIRVDGVDYDEGSKELKDALEAYAKKLDEHHQKMTTAEEDRRKETRDHKAAMDDINTKLAQMQAKTDAAAERAAKAEKEKEDAVKAALAEHTARQVLVATARPILGKKFKFDGVSDKDIKLAVLRETSPELELKGKQDAYIDARFDIAVEQFKGDGEVNGSNVVTDDDDVNREDVGVEHLDALELNERIDAMDLKVADNGTTKSANHIDMENPTRGRVTAYMAMVKRGRSEWLKPLAPSREQLNAKNDSYAGV